MASSRHSRFGTTIAAKLNPNKKRQVDGEAPAPPAEPSTRSIVLHRQQALTHDSGSIMDMVKKQKFRKGKTVDALTREDNLSVEAKNILKSLAKDFIEGCFNRTRFHVPNSPGKANPFLPSFYQNTAERYSF